MTSLNTELARLITELNHSLYIALFLNAHHDHFQDFVSKEDIGTFGHVFKS